jgi:thymidylate synthase (FAD)
VNEYSGRYSVLDDEFYLPPMETLRKQSRTNRQGRSEEELTPEQMQRAHDLLLKIYAVAYEGYEELLEMNLARELARIGLSVANYTQWYWKIDLHNLFHFLMLRMDPHAQHEIQVYGQAIAAIIRDSFPWSFEAFEDYQLFARRFTRLECVILKKILVGHEIQLSGAEVQDLCDEVGMTNRRELLEFLDKMREFDLLKPDVES